MVLCPCGHDLDAHARTGCGGDRRQACRCLRDRYTALVDAVDAARRGAVGARILRKQSLIARQ